MMNKIFVLLLCCISTICVAQLPLDAKRDYIWLMGYEGISQVQHFGLMSLQFNPNLQTPTVSFALPSFDFTNSSIADSTGQLAVYTNGIFIYNRWNEVIAGCDTMSPGHFTDILDLRGDGYRCIQGAIILPYPNHDNQYVVFHAKASDNFIFGQTPWIQLSHLYYNTVDMTANNGHGQVTAMRVPIVSDDSLSQTKLTACRHANGRDWWVTTWSWYMHQYRLILLDPTGVHDLGWVTTQPTKGKSNYGQTVYSPDGSRYATHNDFYDEHPRNVKIEVYDHDRCTGLLYNYRSFIGLDTIGGGLGMSISPNSRFLYVSNPQRIYQYDLEATNIKASGVLVATIDGFVDTLSPTFQQQTAFYLHQLAPDGRIYISSPGGNHYLHTINNPDEAGLACNVQQHSVPLPAFNVGTMPHLPNFRLGALAGSTCDTIYTAVASPSPSQGGEPVHIFPNPATTNTRLVWYTPLKNDANISITNTIGQIVQHIAVSKNATYQDIDTKALPNGVYFIHLNLPSSEGIGKASLKLIKTE
jgi:hypothetical protein